MTNFLICVLIGTVAYGIDILAWHVQSGDKKENHAVGWIMITGVIMGSLLYGLIRLAGWLFNEYGSGLL